MWNSPRGASTTSSPCWAGPSGPRLSGPSCSPSSPPPYPSSSNSKAVKRASTTSKRRRRTKPGGSESTPDATLPIDVWRGTFLDAFPALPLTSQKIVDDWYSSGRWDGPVCDSAYLTPSESEDDGGTECSLTHNTTSAKDKSKGKRASRSRSTHRSGGSLWKHVTTHCNSLDIDAVRGADSRIIHAFLGSICTPHDVLLCGTQFSGTLYPRCACHSKAKSSDSLRIAFESVDLLNFNVHELDRVIFIFEMHNRWFVTLVTSQWLVVYDPAGFCRLEPETVSQFADYVADVFLADAVRWPELEVVPTSLETRIISPDIPIDPKGSAVLVCGAIELMIAVPKLDGLHYPGLEVSLWFLSESIHKDLTHEHYHRLLTSAFKEVESQTKQGDNRAATNSQSNGFKGPPRINAPKVPFKAKRRIKRKKLIVSMNSVPKHEVSPELAAALRAADTKPMRGSKLDKAILDRVVWTCNAGHLPNDDGCTCDFASYCDDLFSDLSLDCPPLAKLA
ncbi:hypothetical protein CspeluHIS016_0108750 [Cutaneotrichosporon spelunceum]|uniref:Uncharacterized protein n=1 Tax=Cutaneotrichosporon spelunceum TaxID=1672016 RepID=A0AAD3TPJ4_9TREE|nr:hypothetical protein CspeluHIS016_0108750 [Cutaneotrichosporon spelunceum]